MAAKLVDVYRKMPLINDDRTGGGGAALVGGATREDGEAEGLGEGNAEGDGDSAVGVGEVSETEGVGCPGLTLAAV